MRSAVEPHPRLPPRARAVVVLSAAAGLCWATPAAAQQGGAVAGAVRDAARSGVQGVELSVVGAATRTLSDGTGAYRLNALPTGVVRLAVRRLGFHPDTVEVTVVAGGLSRLDLELRPLAHQLSAVQVRERRQVYDSRLEGVRARMAKGSGYFITPERLRRANSPMLTDLLREVPGIRFSRSSANLPRHVRIRSNSCPPLVFIDGFPAGAGEFDLDMIDPMSLEAVEVHPSLATMPAEFGAVGGDERCGVIAIWSRPAPGRARRPTPSGQEGRADLERLLEQGRVYTAGQVDRVAVMDSSTAQPDYPVELWQRRVGGRVVVEFIVNPEGEVNAGTVRVVSSTHAEFTTAVQRALEAARFTPATLRQQRVSQIVQLPFVFTVPTDDDLEVERRGRSPAARVEAR